MKGSETSFVSVENREIIQIFIRSKWENDIRFTGGYYKTGLQRQCFVPFKYQ
ncbi:hypothetical protein BGLY_4682 [Bacillus glycinifermentans]|nr:hypothetical protein BGLY_4682 [Bacillus glycinifermentans]